MASSDYIVEVEALGTRYGDDWIHRDLNLNIVRGENLAIVGGSGTGKTVLLRQILMLECPVAGRLRIFGEEVLGKPQRSLLPLRSRLGVMFQHGALFTSMTVLENVALPLWEHTNLSRRMREEIALLKIELAGLPATAARKYPVELSGGMTKRAALARAIALDPELLFLDEPTSGLDPVAAAVFDDLIMELKQLLDLTVVMVSHDADTLWRVTDRIAFLGEKRVLAAEPVEQLANNTHPLIQEYFHGPRMENARKRTWKHE